MTGVGLRLLLLCVVSLSAPAAAGMTGGTERSSPAESAGAPPFPVQQLLDRVARHDLLSEADATLLESWADRTADRLGRGFVPASPTGQTAETPLCPLPSSPISGQPFPPALDAVLANAAEHDAALRPAVRSRLDRLSAAEGRHAGGADLGALLVVAGAASAAVHLFAQTLAQHPSDALTANNLAVALAALGDSQGADDALRYAAMLRPTSPLVLANQGWAALSLGMRAEAQAAFEQALRTDPTAPAPLAGIALLFLCGDRPALANEAASRALDRGYGTVAARVIEETGDAARHDADPRQSLAPAGGILLLPDPAVPRTVRELMGARGETAGIVAQLRQDLLSYEAAEESLAANLAVQRVDIARRGREASATRDGHTLIFPLGQDRSLVAFRRFETAFARQAEAARHEFEAALDQLGAPTATPAVEPPAAGRRRAAVACGPAAAPAEVRHAAFIAGWATYWPTRKQSLAEFLTNTAPIVSRVHDGQVNQYLNLVRTTAMLGTYAEAFDLLSRWGAALRPLAGEAADCAQSASFAPALPRASILRPQACQSHGFAIELRALRLEADCNSVRLTFSDAAAGIEDLLPLDGDRLQVVLTAGSGAEAALDGTSLAGPVGPTRSGSPARPGPFVAFDGRRAVDEASGRAVDSVWRVPADARLALSRLGREQLPASAAERPHFDAVEPATLLLPMQPPLADPTRRLHFLTGRETSRPMPVRTLEGSEPRVSTQAGQARPVEGAADPPPAAPGDQSAEGSGTPHQSEATPIR